MANHEIDLMKVLGGEQTHGVCFKITGSSEEIVAYDRGFKVTDDIGDGGMIVVGSLTIMRGSIQSKALPFAVKVEKDGSCNQVEPQPAWLLIEDGDGILQSKRHVSYTVAPSDPGYFECFTNPDFDTKDHLRHLINLADATEISLIDISTTPDDMALRVINRLLILNIKTQQERDEALKREADLESKLREVMGWMDELLRKGGASPLHALVKSKTPEVAGLAKQVVGLAIRAMYATGITSRCQEYKITTDRTSLPLGRSRFASLYDDE